MTSVDANKAKRRLYREVNERIREIGRSFGADGSLEFLCECGRAECTATVELNHAQCEALFGQDDCILVASHHAEGLDTRRIVAEARRFVVMASG